MLFPVKWYETPHERLSDFASELLPKRAPKLVDRAGGERAIGEFFLLRAIEQVQERNDHRLGARGTASRPPGAALLELQQVGALVVAEGRLVLREQPGELHLEVRDSIGHQARSLLAEPVDDTAAVEVVR
jgi:hypothetical protein